MSNKFVTFEGCEGVGKTTQVQLLKKYLDDLGVDYLLLREPGGNPISEKIRSIILDTNNSTMTKECETMLYCAARAQLVAEIIKPALDEGKIVLCDRFMDSTFAYQGYARGLGLDYVEKLNSAACNGTLPELTIFFDLEPVKAFARKGGQDKDDRLEQESIQFHNNVYLGYKEAQKRSNGRIISIDASKDVDTIHNEVIQVLKDHKII